MELNRERQQGSAHEPGFVNAVLKRLAFRFVLLKRPYTEREFAQFVKQTEFPSVTIEETIGLDIWLEKK